MEKMDHPDTLGSEQHGERHDGHHVRRKAARKKAAPKAKNAGVLGRFDDLSGLLDLKRVRKAAAQYIDAGEKAAKRTIEIQARATQWAKETPLAPIFAAQRDFEKRVVERSAEAARSLWGIG
jgi:hypothetical protein